VLRRNRTSPCSPVRSSIPQDLVPACACASSTPCECGCALTRLDEAQHELVGRYLRRARRRVARVVGIAKKVALGLEDETGPAHLVDDDRLVDPVQRLPFGDALARPARM